MKRLFIMLIITAFAFTALTAVAEGTEKAKKTEKKISCCVKGDCKEMTRADCTKAGGKVVADCGQCKAPKATKPAAKNEPKSKAPTLGND